jgi:gamma-glutamyltranspeptidase/glutathione hydrolase
MSAAESLAAARLHNQILPNVTYIEGDSSKPGQTPVQGLSEEVAEGLRKKGHIVERIKSESSSRLILPLSLSHWPVLSLAAMK